jgi:hypothetical protein
MPVDYAGSTGFRLPEIDFRYMPHMDVLGAINSGIKLGNTVQNNFGVNAPVNLSRSLAVKNMQEHPEFIGTTIDENGNPTTSYNPVGIMNAQAMGTYRGAMGTAALQNAESKGAVVPSNIEKNVAQAGLTGAQTDTAKKNLELVQNIVGSGGIGAPSNSPTTAPTIKTRGTSNPGAWATKPTAESNNPSSVTSHPEYTDPAVYNIQ